MSFLAGMLLPDYGESGMTELNMFSISLLIPFFTPQRALSIIDYDVAATEDHTLELQFAIISSENTQKPLSLTTPDLA